MSDVQFSAMPWVVDTENQRDDQKQNGGALWLDTRTAYSGWGRWCRHFFPEGLLVEIFGFIDEKLNLLPTYREETRASKL